MKISHSRTRHVVLSLLLPLLATPIRAGEAGPGSGCGSGGCLAGSAAAVHPSGQRSKKATTGPLFEALLTHIKDNGASGTRPLTVRLGENVGFRVVEADTESVRLQRIGSDPEKEPPLRWPWQTVPSNILLDFYRSLPGSRENVLAFYETVHELGFPEEAASRLNDLIERDPESRMPAYQRIAERLGVEIPEEGFVYFQDAFTTPALRDAAYVDLADAWMVERELERAERAESAESLFRKALRMLTAGHYRLGVKVLRKAARSAAGTKLGDMADARSRENDFIHTTPLYVSGDSGNRVDIIIAGDGYVLEDRAQLTFDRACDQLVKYFLEREVLDEYRGYLNFHRVNTWSKESGVDTPTSDASTALGGAWSETAAQGQVTVNHGLVHQMMRAHVPHGDTTLVMVRRGGLGTGGGGVAAFAHASPGIAYHEFGHSFVGLLDEYSTQTSKVRPTGPGPRGVNVTNTEDPEATPWKHFIDRKVPGIGLFPGGAGRTDGVWHPSELGCVMKSGTEFCPVCREEAVLRIYSHARPVDEITPPAGEVLLPAQGSSEFRLVILRPKSHRLTVDFKFNGKSIPGHVERRDLRPEKGSAAMREEVVFTLDPTVIQVVEGYSNALMATVKDETEWVLKDSDDKLTQTVSWDLKKEKR